MTSSRGRRRGSSKISSRVNKKSVSKRVAEDSSDLQTMKLPETEPELVVEIHVKMTARCIMMKTVLPPPKKPRGRPRKNQEPRVLESHPGASHLESQGQRFGSQSHQGSQRQGQGSQAHGTSQGSRADGASQGPRAQSQSQEQQGVHGFASWFECSN